MANSPCGSEDLHIFKVWLNGIMFLFLIEMDRERENTSRRNVTERSSFPAEQGLDPMTLGS